MNKLDANSNDADNELQEEIGRLTRIHAVIGDETGWMADGKLQATSEFLDGISNLDLGEIVLGKAQSELAKLL